jgi:flagellar hook-associated protein 3 FlgL
VQVGNGQMVTIGIAASTNGSVSSTGTSTTQSYMRDIMRALATIGSLTSAQVTSGADVAGLVADTQASLSGAITALGQDQGVLGDRQTMLTNSATAMSTAQTALLGQFTDATNVDMAKTMTSLTETQTRLQASYQLISNLSSLSLVKYI